MTASQSGVVIDAALGRLKRARHERGRGNGTAGRLSTAQGIEATAAEQPLRAKEEHQQQQRVGDQIAVDRAQIAARQRFEHAEQEAADDGTGDAGDAAEQCRGEPLDAQGNAHGRPDRLVVEADQHATDAADQPGNGEGQAAHQGDVDAHLLGGLRVHGRGPHCPADPGAVQEERQSHDGADADHEDQDIDRRNVGIADLPGGRCQRAREGLGIRRPDEVNRLVEDDGDGQRCQQRRDARTALEWPQERPIDDQTEQCGERHRERRRQDQRQAEQNGEGVGQVAADDEERALGEIDEIGDAEHQHEADRQHRVDVADRKPVEDLAEKLGHRCPKAGAAPLRTVRRRCRWMASGRGCRVSY